MSMTQVSSMYHGTTMNSTAPPSMTRVSHHDGYGLDHADEFVQLMLSYYDSKNPTPKLSLNSTNANINIRGGGITDAKADSSHLLLLPRIGILNRKESSGRSLLNARQLVAKLQKRLSMTLTATRESNTTSSTAREMDATNGSTSSSSRSTIPSIPIVTFDGLSFEEQINFFRSIDILISPHGAQLTGIPFLLGSYHPHRNSSVATDVSTTIMTRESVSSVTKERKCKYLLELFPQDYLWSVFFGSLARASEIQYSYMYLSNHRPKQRDFVQRRHKARDKARSQQFCPPLDPMVEISESIVLEWKACRDAPLTTRSQQVA